MALEKEYVVNQIRASSDVSPYVYLSLKDPDPPEQAAQGTNFSSFSYGSMDEMMKNLSRALTQQAAGGFTTVLKLMEDEYKEMDVRVGDRVTIHIAKTQIGDKMYT